MGDGERATARLPMGKASRAFLEKVVFENLGARRSSVLVGPGHGRDNAVISLPGKRKVMVVTADPLSIIPSLGMERSAWLTAHLLASDLATSGVAPQFAVLDFNLPPKLGTEDFRSYLKALGREFERMGVAIVGGHTGSYPGCDYTIAGGGMMFSFADESGYVTPSMAKAGDVLLMTKGAAIATTAVLAWAFPNRVSEETGAGILARAKGYLRECSTVREALEVSSLGLRDRVTSMHDATEGGVLGGAYELASACGRAVTVDTDSIHVSRETREVCALFGLDPLVSLSEGTLLITCRPDAVGEVVATLRRSRVACFAIGRVGESGEGLRISSKGGRPKPFVPPEGDRYWEEYAAAARRGWG